MRMGVMVSVVFAAILASLPLVTGAQAASHVLATGTFVGASGHATSGGVSIVQTDAGTMVVLEENFKFDGAPDPKVGFGRALDWLGFPPPSFSPCSGCRRSSRRPIIARA